MIIATFHCILQHVLGVLLTISERLGQGCMKQSEMHPLHPFYAHLFIVGPYPEHFYNIHFIDDLIDYPMLYVDSA